MDTRRDFFKKSFLLTGAAGLANVLPASIQKAMAIDPKAGSTYLNAEHVVILMQENRSFDHCFGTLKGVRGYNDPRAIRLPDDNLVWLQSNEKGETYAPFRFDIRNTKATWMGSVPHSRSSQVDANNLGKYDNWLPSKRVNNKKFAEMPLTLGHYTQEDIPFYYALADAFTVCDQNFSSAMTSTNPNRLFFWAGTVREEQKKDANAIMRNLSGDRWGVLTYKTFPERLEENGVSWKFYQNDIDCGGGFDGNQRAWLANFGCNPLEWFANYNVKFSSRYIKSLQKQLDTLPAEIAQLKDKIAVLSPGDNNIKKYQVALSKKQEVLAQAQKQVTELTKEAFDSLSEKEKSLYRSAFTTNAGDPDYHDLTNLNYRENGQYRELPVPKGDVLYQFRKDVEAGQLPTVSWLAAAQNFSDHPSAPWYGSLYLSEILNILTKNPEVWKKTIFIVTFDENDGYYDHVPPFVAPDPLDASTGKCSPGLDTSLEYIRLEDELKKGIPKREARGGPVGLGFRVPMIVASPWSRGGQVCSQVFDHTSTLQFLEKFLNGKLGKAIKEDNISNWRRTVTGDLTTAFKPHDKASDANLPFLKKDPFIEKIYNAKFKKLPADYKPLSAKDIKEINNSPASSPIMPQQEKGIKPSCAVPYELYADALLSEDKKQLNLSLQAKNEIFGKEALGAPFNVYIPTNFNTGKKFERVGSRSYAVIAGDNLGDTFPLEKFENGLYHLAVYGPNGFYRAFKGAANEPAIIVSCAYETKKGLVKKLSGNILLKIKNLDPANTYKLLIRDKAYNNKAVSKTLEKAGSARAEVSIILNLAKSHNWYDFSLTVDGFDNFERQYAGHVETGEDSFSDPAMGRIIT